MSFREAEVSPSRLLVSIVTRTKSASGHPMAMHQPLYRVVYEDALWTVLDEHGNRLSELLQTQADGVIRAKSLAVENKDGSARILVQNDKGAVVSDFVYQREERSSLERDEAPYDSYYVTRPAHRASRPSHP
jgi:hypothetical protein